MACGAFTLDGNPYTAVYFTNQMTRGVLTSLFLGGFNYGVITVLQSPWAVCQLPIYDIVGDGEVSFGVSGASSITIDLTTQDTSTAPDYYVEVFCYIDSVAYPSMGVPIAILTNEAPTSYSEVIPLSECCTTVTLLATSVRADIVPGDIDGVLSVNAEVIDITSDPTCDSTSSTTTPFPTTPTTPSTTGTTPTTPSTTGTTTTPTTPSTSSTTGTTPSTSSTPTCSPCYPFVPATPSLPPAVPNLTTVSIPVETITTTTPIPVSPLSVVILTTTTTVTTSTSTTTIQPTSTDPIIEKKCETDGCNTLGF